MAKKRLLGLLHFTDEADTKANFLYEISSGFCVQKIIQICSLLTVIQETAGRHFLRHNVIYFGLLFLVFFPLYNDWKEHLWNDLLYIEWEVDNFRYETSTQTED